jgi:hypothetical protein
MSLRLLDLPLLLNTSDHDLIADFFAPALNHAFRYDRGVGYFSSGWLRLAAQGMGGCNSSWGHGGAAEG